MANNNFSTSAGNQTESEIMTLLNSNSEQSEQPVQTSIWTTVNTSTTDNVERLEIRKSEDFDRVVKKSK